MLNVKVDELEVIKLCREQVQKIVQDVEGEYVFWDSAELKKRTCMSWNFIQELFFYDPRFTKRKIGGKWYFPAKETREFLEAWLKEQSH
ncbi:group-specific protein [Paenibacillus kribbensis]|uniref:group-specific protein n=1 Tax=Paenibacillus kribbensis TaxID=172713 RepID=UPI000838E543|nr:group-specific protein [Paenibacillus kribbensis]